MEKTSRTYDYGEIYKFNGQHFGLVAAAWKECRFVFESVSGTDCTIIVDTKQNTVCVTGPFPNTLGLIGKASEVVRVDHEFWENLSGSDQETHEWEQNERDARFAEHLDSDLGFAAEDAMTDDEYWDKYRRIATGEPLDDKSFDYEFWGDALGDIL